MNKLVNQTTLKFFGLIVAMSFHFIKLDFESKYLKWLALIMVGISSVIFLYSFLMKRKLNLTIVLSFFAISIGISSHIILCNGSIYLENRGVFDSDHIEIFCTISFIMVLIGSLHIFYTHKEGLLPPQV